MIKKLYLPLVALMVLALSSCGKMGELSSDYFTTNPEVLEAVAGKVPVTINGKFPEKYMKKNATVEVTPVIRWNGGEAKGQPATFQGEKVQGNGPHGHFQAARLCVRRLRPYNPLSITPGDHEKAPAHRGRAVIACAQQPVVYLVIKALLQRQRHFAILRDSQHFAHFAVCRVCGRNTRG